MKTAAAMMFGTPESTREIVEHRDKIRSQALNFALLSMAIFSLFEPLRAARSKFAARALQSASRRLILKQRFTREL